MPTIDVGKFEDSFTLHFGGDYSRINAYTLATTLVGIADAAKAANATLNPGFEIEVVVESLGQGSFRATLRTVYAEAENIFSKESLRNVVLAVVASFIYQHTLAPESDVIVNVTGDEVVVTQGDTRVVIPRHVHEATQEVENIPSFRRGIGDAIRSVEIDEAIDNFGIAAGTAPPDFTIPRERLGTLTQEIAAPRSLERDVVEITDLQITRAILERSNKRWQFVWNGVRISAPVLDQSFYNDFFDHTITLAPGDVLRVRLKIKQKLNEDIGIYINESYEVLEVMDHFPRPKQTLLSRSDV